MSKFGCVEVMSREQYRYSRFRLWLANVLIGGMPVIANVHINKPDDDLWCGVLVDQDIGPSGVLIRCVTFGTPNGQFKPTIALHP